ncbi:MAG: hypothetical protein OEW19_07390 [Acidobacteriota bacterium]|nr:hypothetical protein [Acidobacteriota bacterium]
MIERLRQEAIAGFPRLAGARLTGHVPVSQAVVDEALAHVPRAVDSRHQRGAGR